MGCPGGVCPSRGSGGFGGVANAFGGGGGGSTKTASSPCGPNGCGGGGTQQAGSSQQAGGGKQEDPKDAKIKELTQENEQLKAKVQGPPGRFDTGK